TLLVIVPPPLLDDLPGIADGNEPVLVQALVAELAVEALDIAVLHRFSRLDEVLLHPFGEAPLVQRTPGELRAVVGADLPWSSALADQPLQHPHHARSRQRGVHLNRQALTRVVIHHVQRAQLASRAERVGHEVQRPHLVRCRGRRQGQTRHTCTTLAPPLPHLQPFQPIEPTDPLVIHPPALAHQPLLQTAIAKAPELVRQLAQPLPQSPVLRAPRPVSVRPPDAVRSARRRVAPRPRFPSASLPPPASASAGLPLFCDHRLQRLLVQRQVRHQVLQPPVLLLQRPQPPRLAYLHPTVLRLPAVQTRSRNAMPATQLAGIGPCFRLPQNGDDLFFVESTLAHDSSSALAGYVKGRSLISNGLISGGQVTGTSMADNTHMFVRPPKEAGGFFTVEDSVKNVLAYGRTVEEIAIEWHRIDDQKVIVEKLIRQSYGSSNRLFSFI